MHVSFTDFVHRVRRTVQIRDVVVSIIIAIAYTATRLINLKALPIFSDEGIYINWARIAAGDVAWRFISLTDGKQPLQTWGTLLFVKLFPADLLLAGRLFSVVTGFVALVGLVAVCARLWGRRGALIGAMLYIVTPFFLFYDRIALVDSGVNAAFLWIFFCSLILPVSRRLDVAMIFGIIAGIGLLAKSSVLLFVGLSFFGFLFILESKDKQSNIKRFTIQHLFKKIAESRKAIIDFIALFFVTCVFAIALYLIQKFFSPFFHYIAEKNLTFIVTPQEWLREPFALVANNAQIVPLYVAWESGWLPLVFGIAGFWITLRKRFYLACYIALWIGIPLIMILNFNKVVFPRYLIFFPSLLVILSTAFFVSIQRKSIQVAAIAVTVLLLAAQSFPILFNVREISLPEVDRGQYIDGQTAVWGVDELVDIIRSDVNANQKPAYVLAEGNFGLIADVLEVMKRPGDRISIQGVWPLNEEHILQAIRTEMPENQLYVVFSHRKDFPVHWRDFMDEVRVFYKPDDKTTPVYLYKVKPTAFTTIQQ